MFYLAARITKQDFGSLLLRRVTDENEAHAGQLGALELFVTGLKVNI